MAKAKPIKPRPSSPSVAGSGTLVIMLKPVLPAPTCVIVAICVRVKPLEVSTAAVDVPEYAPGPEVNQIGRAHV